MISKSTTAPIFIYGSRHGTIYNLTPTNLPKFIPAIQLCYGDFHDYTQTIKNLPEGMSFKKFLGYPQSTLTYLAPYDVSKPDCMTGCHQDTKVKIKCNKGYTEVTALMYDEMIDLLKPDYFIGLTQFPSLQKNHQSNSNKSYKRAINKTKSYLQLSKFTRNQEEDNNYQGPVRLAPLHGGTNLSLISRSLEQILNYAIDGIVVCDLCEGETLNQREEVYKIIFQRLEQEYKRENSYFKNKRLQLVLAGQGHLQDIEHALKFGFSAFQIHHPFTAAEKHQALLMNKETTKIQLYSPVKAPSLSPLDPECKCYTCQNHSEAYIAHLIDCYQLTAKVLLSIHNIQIYEVWLKNYGSEKSIQKIV